MLEAVIRVLVNLARTWQSSSVTEPVRAASDSDVPGRLVQDPESPKCFRKVESRFYIPEDAAHPFCGEGSAELG